MNIIIAPIWRNIIFYSILLIAIIYAFMVYVLIDVESQMYPFLSIVNLDDPTHPVFCISTREDCTGDGIEIRDLFVYEETEDGRGVRIMWHLETKDYRLKKISKFKYGVVPDGFIEVTKSVPLELNKLYVFEKNIIIINKVANGYICTFTQAGRSATKHKTFIDKASK